MKTLLKNGIIIFVSAVMLLLGAVVSHAGQCNIVATPVSFGNYNVFAVTPLDATGTITVSCNIPPKKGGAVVSIQVDSGNGSLGQRVMISEFGEQMLYNLYTDSALSTVFGTAGDPAMSQLVNRSTPYTLTIYGRIPALQAIGAGTYADLLTATILW